MPMITATTLRGGEDPQILDGLGPALHPPFNRAQDHLLYLHDPPTAGVRIPITPATHSH